MGQVTFQKTYGGLNYESESVSVRQTIDGGYILSACTFSFGVGVADFYLIKTDSTGDTLWTKTFGGSGDDENYSVQQTMDGGYIIGGYSDSFDSGFYKVYLIKTNNNGDTLWTKTYGGSSSDLGYFVQQTTDSGYVIIGRTTSFGAGSDDVYLIKTNSIGDIEWTKTFGGTATDIGWSGKQTTDGGYIIVGGTNSYGAGNEDVYLIKTNSTGDTIWTRTYGGSINESGNEIQQTTDGGYIITGLTNSFGAGGSDVFLIKTDSSGYMLWAKTYGGSNNDMGFSVIQTTDGGYIITGSTYSFGTGGEDLYLIKTNSTGDTIWTKTYGGIFDDRGTSIQQTTDGGYIISGYTNSFGAGGNDIYLIKTDSNGNSGCHQNSPATIQGNPAFQMAYTTTQIHSGGNKNNTFTSVGNGGILTSECSNVGINDIKWTSFISLFPNPFSTSATLLINGEIKENSYLYIYNLLGQEVKTFPIINQKEIIINRDNLAAGMYFYKIIGRNRETIATGKMVIN
jgi:hypothetical protein